MAPLIELLRPCPPYNYISNPFNGPPSVSGQRKHAAVDFPGWWEWVGAWGTWVWHAIPNGADVIQPIVGGAMCTEVGRYGQPGYGQTGNMVELQADGVRVRMLHMQTVSAVKGQHYAAGERVAKANNTGTSTGTHVHLAAWVDDWATALQYMPDPTYPPERVYLNRVAIDPALLFVKEDDVSKQDVLDALNTPMQELGNRSMAWVVQHQIDYGVEQSLHATIVGMEAYRAERPSTEWPALDAQLTALKGQELYYRQKAQGLIP